MKIIWKDFKFDIIKFIFFFLFLFLINNKLHRKSIQGRKKKKARHTGSVLNGIKENETKQEWKYKNEEYQEKGEECIEKWWEKNIK